MEHYTEKDLIHLAKRFNNTKRNFLLVNPLQGKHIPVSPTKSIEMVSVLGDKVALKYPKANLVIGFAETATAIGFMVAKCLSKNCNYITTTRENLVGSHIEFKEEHSHAVEQKLYDENFKKYLSNTDEIILVDDELTTGKTVVNFINQLKKKYPEIKSKKIIAVSIINRLSYENLECLVAEGIFCEYLIKSSDMDYESFVEQFNINPQDDYFNIIKSNAVINQIEVSKFNSCFIKGVNCENFSNECENIAIEALDIIKKDLNKNDDILILGTEEFMYQGIVLGRLIEDKNIVNSVKFHATTRSPIGVCNSEIYPIKNGYKINSFYDLERTTFIYNLQNYDKVIVFTDSSEENSRENAISGLFEVLKAFGVREIIFLKGGLNV